MVEIKCYKVLLLHYILILYNLGGDLSRAQFLGGRFAEGRLVKGPNCPAPNLKCWKHVGQ